MKGGHNNISARKKLLSNSTPFYPRERAWTGLDLKSLTKASQVLPTEVVQHLVPGLRELAPAGITQPRSHHFEQFEHWQIIIFPLIEASPFLI